MNEEERRESRPRSAGEDPSLRRTRAVAALALAATGVAIEFEGIAAYARASFRALLFDPSYRSLRYLLLAGLIVRAILVPLTSWSSDTPGFVLGDISFVVLGSPYTSTALFNPPAAASFSAPLFALLLLERTPQQLVTFQPSMLPVASGVAANFFSPYLPDPASLVAVKLPLVAADVGTALLLVFAVRRAGFPQYVPWVAGAYFLNPLTIWISAVHAEPDGLAAFFVMLALVALLVYRPFLAGLSLGFGVFSKVYPLILIPLALAWCVSFPSATGRTSGRRTSAFVRAIAGLLASLVVFLPFVRFFTDAYSRTVSANEFGGVSLLAFYNPASPAFGHLTATVRSYLSGQSVLLLFDAATVLSLVATTLLVLRGPRHGPLGEAARVRTLFLSGLLVLAAVFLAYPSPQPNNVVAVVPLAVVLVPAYGAVYRWSYWVLTFSAFLLYMAYTTPFGAFFPLWVAAGPSAVSRATAVILSYVSGKYAMPPGYYWFLAGVVGGAALLVLWCATALTLLPARWKAEVRRRVARFRAPLASPRVP